MPGTSTRRGSQKAPQSRLDTGHHGARILEVAESGGVVRQGFVLEQYAGSLGGLEQTAHRVGLDPGSPFVTEHYDSFGHACIPLVMTTAPGLAFRALNKPSTFLELRLFQVSFILRLALLAAEAASPPASCISFSLSSLSNFALTVSFAALAT